MIEIVNAEGSTIGIRRRSEAHCDPSLLHKVVHVLVFNDSGKILLQKRSMNKDIAPGKWDTSVGGHVSPGEDLKTAALREMKEELGIIPEDIEPLYSYIHSDSHESELVSTYRCMHNGPFPFNREEVDEVAFWSIDEIRKSIGKGIFSAHFESEVSHYLSYKRKR